MHSKALLKKFEYSASNVYRVSVQIAEMFPVLPELYKMFPALFTKWGRIFLAKQAPVVGPRLFLSVSLSPYLICISTSMQTTAVSLIHTFPPEFPARRYHCHYGVLCTIWDQQLILLFRCDRASTKYINSYSTLTKVSAWFISNYYFIHFQHTTNCLK